MHGRNGGRPDPWVSQNDSQSCRVDVRTSRAVWLHAHGMATQARGGWCFEHCFQMVAACLFFIGYPSKRF